MKVKIYVSDHCIFCQEAVRFFQDKGIPLEIINVTQNQDYIDEMFRLGGIATPFIIIREHIFYSFDQKKIEKAVELSYLE